MSSDLSRVVIVGRPNVGKSTLFNRLVRRKIALVHQQPGMTRDRRQEQVHLYDRTFLLTDTAGLAEENPSVFSEDMYRQTFQAVAEADLVLFVVDARQGCTPYDRDLAMVLRQQKTPILVLANKCEGQRESLAGLSEASALGLGPGLPISAEHGEGLYDLYTAICPFIPEKQEQTVPQAAPIRLAVVGRPNVGKSTLINQLLGEERLITADFPGVTRDSISLDWVYADRRFRLTDTAGLRRHAKVCADPERLAVMDTKRTIQYSEVVVVLVDATAPFEKQDLSIASDIHQEGRALVLALNKWDLVRDKNSVLDKVRLVLETQLTQVRGISCIPISAVQGKNLDQLMDAVLQAHDLWNSRLPTAQLNKWLEFACEKHTPPLVNGRRIRLKYMTQIKSRPPTFALFSSQPTELPESYQRYLVNQLREDFKLWGVPVRLFMRGSKNPYEGLKNHGPKGPKKTKKNPK